jgi:hypothetical protein
VPACLNSIHANLRYKRKEPSFLIHRDNPEGASGLDHTPLAWRCRWAQLIKEAAVRQVTVQPGRRRPLRWPGVDSGLGRLVGDDGREGRERRQHGHGGGHVGAAAVGLEGASRCLEAIAVVALANLMIVVLQAAMVEGEARAAAARVWEWRNGVMRLLLEAKARGVHGVVVGALHHHHLAVLVHCLVEYPADHPFLLRASKDSSVNQE